MNGIIFTNKIGPHITNIQFNKYLHERESRTDKEWATCSLALNPISISKSITSHEATLQRIGFERSIRDIVIRNKENIKIPSKSHDMLYCHCKKGLCNLQHHISASCECKKIKYIVQETYVKVRNVKHKFPNNISPIITLIITMASRIDGDSVWRTSIVKHQIEELQQFVDQNVIRKDRHLALRATQQALQILIEGAIEISKVVGEIYKEQYPENNKYIKSTITDSTSLQSLRPQHHNKIPERTQLANAIRNNTSITQFTTYQEYHNADTTLNIFATPFIPNSIIAQATSFISDTKSTLSDNLTSSTASSSCENSKHLFDVFKKSRKKKSKASTNSQTKKKIAKTKFNLQKVNQNNNISHDKTITDWATTNTDKLAPSVSQDRLLVKIPFNCALDYDLSITKRSPTPNKHKSKSGEQLYMKCQKHKARTSVARKSDKPILAIRQVRPTAEEVTPTPVQHISSNLSETNNETSKTISITNAPNIGLQMPPYARQLQATTSVVTKPRKWNDYYISDTSSCHSPESTISSRNSSADTMISILTNSVEATTTTLYDMFTSSKKKGTIKRIAVKNLHGKSVENNKNGHHTTSELTPDAAALSNTTHSPTCRAAPTGIS
jgi:hypothetical protein